MDEVDDNALTLVQRAGVSDTVVFPMYGAKNSITLRIPVPDVEEDNLCFIRANCFGRVGIAYCSRATTSCCHRKSA